MADARVFVVEPCLALVSTYSWIVDIGATDRVSFGSSVIHKTRKLHEREIE